MTDLTVEQRMLRLEVLHAYNHETLKLLTEAVDEHVDRIASLIDMIGDPSAPWRSVEEIDAAKSEYRLTLGRLKAVRARLAGDRRVGPDDVAR